MQRLSGSNRSWIAGVLLGLAVLLCGCSGQSARSSTATPTDVRPSATGAPSLAGGGGEQETSTPPSTKPSTTATKPLPVKSLPVGVVERNADSCPFIATDDASAAEGNRISSVSQLVRGTKVIGCRFRFWCGDFHYTLEIASQTYADATTAYNAMVRLGQAGGEVIGVPSLAPAVDGVLYRTTFYPPDGNQDWACSFAKGKTVVTVKTDQNDTSKDALNVAKLINSKF